MRESISAVAFDIDGTLYPNWRLYIRIIPFFLANLRLYMHYSAVRKILHRTAPLPDFYAYQAILLAERLHISPKEARELITSKVYDKLAVYFKKVKPYQNVEETFLRFRKAGLKLAILSDFPPEQKGDIWGVRGLSDVVLGSEECGALKPSSYPFGILSQELGIPPERILYVGNSIRSDIEGARSAGMKTAYIMPLWRRLLGLKLKQADISFGTYRQLANIVLE
ncbi:MAG: HAD family hydrolase [Spirochaetaceae bacterium]|jgi:putative hydrolase of the HAD superfamily|nr:HAD family hydrolase [Spirochaetaceae bacterium]